MEAPGTGYQNQEGEIFAFRTRGASSSTRPRQSRQSAASAHAELSINRNTVNLKNCLSSIRVNQHLGGWSAITYMHQVEFGFVLINRKNPAQVDRNPADRTSNGAYAQNGPKQKMYWFLKRVPLIWLFFTAVIIAAVLYSIYQSGGMN
ncbi:MAG: hypothetical protein WB780_09510 [Candidatus Acidiferrales bacterium]